MDEKIKSQNPAERGQKENLFLFTWEIVKIAILALVIILPVRYFIAQPFFVKGASMELSFEDGDYLIIDEISYRLSEPKRGDVIVFRFPEDPSQFFIKRIIGLPDETIELKHNQITIYNQDNPTGFVLDESAYLDIDQKTESELRMKMDENEYFVLGDNRLHSSDSRIWGALNKSFIVGRALIRAWPFDEAKFFSPVSYPISQ